MAAPLKSNSVRNTRITLTVPRNVSDGVKALAQIQDKSLNDFICQLLEAEVKKKAALLHEYNAAKIKWMHSINSADIEGADSNE